MGISGDRGDRAKGIDDPLTHSIIDAIIHVHQVLGPGFGEIIYRRALVLELRKRGIAVAAEVEINVTYDGQTVGQYRLDLVVENRVIVELKAVEELAKVHYSQVRSYLRAAGLPVALLVNFALPKADWRRVIVE